MALQRVTSVRLHVAAVLAADLVERVRQLAERAHLAGLHQRGEDVAAVERRRCTAASAAGAVAALRFQNASRAAIA